MDYKDYYKVLNVEKTATADEIKKAYRKLARKYHPDVSKEADAESQMKEVNEANAVLSDKEKRAAYDKLGNSYQSGQNFNPPPDWNAGFEYSGNGMPNDGTADFSDFFANLFRQRQQEGQRSSARQSRGEDHHAKIFIELVDTFRGVTRAITLQTPQQNAQGQVTLKERTLNVKIPKGVKEGQHIRLPGQGTPSYADGTAGDLFLEINFKPNILYRVEGRDLYESVSVSPWEAALGTNINVPTPLGSVQMKIPENSQSGQKLRLKGQGIPGGGMAGDLFVILQVVLPPADTEAAKAFYGKMANEFSFDPRK